MPRHVYTKAHLLSLRPRPAPSVPIRIVSPPHSPKPTPTRTPPSRTPPSRTPPSRTPPSRSPPTSSPPPGFGYRARSPPNVPRIARGPDPPSNFSRRIEYARNRTQPVVVSSEIDALFEDDFDAFAKRLASHAAHPAQFGEIKNLRDVPELSGDIIAPVDAVPADALDDHVLEFFDSIKCQALANGAQDEFAFGEPEMDPVVTEEGTFAKAPVATVPEPVGKERVDPALGDLERWFHALASASGNE